MVGSFGFSIGNNNELSYYSRNIQNRSPKVELFFFLFILGTAAFTIVPTILPNIEFLLSTEGYLKFVIGALVSGLLFYLPIYFITREKNPPAMELFKFEFLGYYSLFFYGQIGIGFFKPSNSPYFVGSYLSFFLIGGLIYLGIRKPNFYTMKGKIHGNELEITSHIDLLKRKKTWVITKVMDPEKPLRLRIHKSTPGRFVTRPKIISRKSFEESLNGHAENKYGKYKYSLHYLDKITEGKPAFIGTDKQILIAETNSVTDFQNFISEVEKRIPITITDRIWRRTTRTIVRETLTLDRLKR